MFFLAGARRGVLLAGKSSMCARFHFGRGVACGIYGVACGIFSWTFSFRVRGLDFGIFFVSSAYETAAQLVLFLARSSALDAHHVIELALCALPLRMF